MSIQKVIIHANNVDWQQEYLPRFTAGFAEGHGIRVIHKQEDTPEFTLSPSGRKIYIENFHMIFANNSWKLTHLICNNHDFPLLTVGRCFFGSRFDMVAIGWDGFNGAADFCLEDEMPGDRWEKHGSALPENMYGDPDGYVLVCGEFRECDKWYNTMREVLAGEDVRFRAHPFKAGQTVSGWKNAPSAGQDDIGSLFKDCKAVVTFDSIAGCDAVLAGVPHIAWGENSMARDVSFHSWRAFKKWYDSETVTLPFDVEQWAYRLAYCQWSHDEISNGEFWDHLKSRMVASEL